MKIDDLVDHVGNLPPTAPSLREVQAFDFAYLAASSPVRSAFYALSIVRGWTAADFRDWAKDKVWAEE